LSGEQTQKNRVCISLLRSLITLRLSNRAKRLWKKGQEFHNKSKPKTRQEVPGRRSRNKEGQGGMKEARSAS